MVLDALNGVLWADDAQVVEVAGRKLFGREERTHIDVEFIEREEAA